MPETTPTISDFRNALGEAMAELAETGNPYWKLSGRGGRALSQLGRYLHEREAGTEEGSSPTLDTLRERIAEEAWIGTGYPDRRDEPVVRRIWRDVRDSEDTRVVAAYATADRVLALLPAGSPTLDTLLLERFAEQLWRRDQATACMGQPHPRRAWPGDVAEEDRAAYRDQAAPFVALLAVGSPTLNPLNAPEDLMSKRDLERYDDDDSEAWRYVHPGLITSLAARIARSALYYEALAGGSPTGGAAPDAEERSGRTVHCLRVYLNGQTVEKTLDAGEVPGWVSFNSQMRPGCALFVDGICVARGYVPLEQREAITAAVRADMQATGAGVPLSTEREPAPVQGSTDTERERDTLKACLDNWQHRLTPLFERLESEPEYAGSKCAIAAAVAVIDRLRAEVAALSSPVGKASTAGEKLQDGEEPAASPFTPRAADALAVAVLEAIDRGEIRTRTKISDALEAFAGCRFDVNNGREIQLLREFAERRREPSPVPGDATDA